VILTEWKEFRSPDFEEIAKQLKTKQIFDGRNLYEPAVVRRAGLVYEGIGRRA
jgi:UDPglucose 6-dehydrogenase